jgi:hypothetical protein
MQIPPLLRNVCAIFVFSEFTFLPKILRQTRTLQKQQQQQEQQQQQQRGLCKKNFVKLKKVDFDDMQLKCNPIATRKKSVLKTKLSV